MEKVQYNRCPKSERWVWKTERNLVRISYVRISDIRAVRFVQSFGYTINVENPTFGWSSPSTERLKSQLNRPDFGQCLKSELFHNQAISKNAEIQMFRFQTRLQYVQAFTLKL